MARLSEKEIRANDFGDAAEIVSGRVESERLERARLVVVVEGGELVGDEEEKNISYDVEDRSNLEHHGDELKNSS